MKIDLAEKKTKRKKKNRKTKTTAPPPEKGKLGANKNLERRVPSTRPPNFHPKMTNNSTSFLHDRSRLLQRSATKKPIPIYKNQQTHPQKTKSLFFFFPPLSELEWIEISTLEAQKWEKTREKKKPKNLQQDWEPSGSIGNQFSRLLCQIISSKSSVFSHYLFYIVLRILFCGLRPKSGEPRVGLFWGCDSALRLHPPPPSLPPSPFIYFPPLF